MVKTPGDFEKEFIETIKEKTGKTLAEWFDVIKPEGHTKLMATLNWLKKQYGLNHMQANLLAGLYLNDGKPVYSNEADLLGNQFLKCAGMRPLFDACVKKILAQFPDVQVIPKKTYVSFTAKREFLAINIKPSELRLGLDLGELPFTDRLQKSKLTGPMPRISHMVVVTAGADIDKELTGWFMQSYNRTHTK